MKYVIYAAIAVLIILGVAIGATKTGLVEDSVGLLPQVDGLLGTELTPVVEVNVDKVPDAIGRPPTPVVK
jgi:hypothetical protein|tara:strand:+ start:490 stop:699 length:210 start_codon:yes stop_codon:yes gene_type:complete